MTTYFLDTNICAHILNGKFPALTERFLKCAKSDVKISAVVLYELYYGAEKSRWRERNLGKIQTFISEIEVVAFDDRAAERAGQIRADLERNGQIIGGNDIMIAAVALANNAALVTNNTREFERVEGLTFENWIK
ncbi:MAG: PIN domain-containing protein [Peptococcaceae bacterium]|nr:PIN domain-containing protein [Peptococcaceae bacterium]